MTERLLDAVASLRYKQIEFLIGSGVDVNSRNSKGQTALMITCFLSQEDKRYRMFRFLLKHKADILDLDDNDTSVFHYACMRNCLDIVKLILKVASVAAVNLASTDKFGKTALFYAVTSGNVDMVTLLVTLMRERGISVDAADKSGRTPLLQATMLGHTELARILEVEGRANPRICDREMHMNANGWAARKQKTQGIKTKEISQVHKIIFPKITASMQGKARHFRKDRNQRSPSLPMISYKDITEAAEDVNHRNGLGNISVSESNKLRRKKPSYLTNKSFDSAMSLLELSSRSKINNDMHIENSPSMDRSGQIQNDYRSSNFYTVNKMLGVSSDQLTTCYRKAAVPMQPCFKDRHLTLATLAKVLPSENAHGPRFLSVRRNARGKTPNRGSVTPSAESELELAESSASLNPDGGPLWKRLRKKSVSMTDIGGEDGDGISGGGGGSLSSRVKKSRTNSVPHIVTTNAR